jgi:hypothetical protein
MHQTGASQSALLRFNPIGFQTSACVQESIEAGFAKKAV